MAEMIEAYLQNGVISRVSGREASPRTEEFRDGITYINEAVEGTPPSFEVDFKIISSFRVGGDTAHPYISISVPVAVESKNTSFRDIEDQAVREVVPILRAVADAVEKQLAAYVESLDSPTP